MRKKKAKFIGAKVNAVVVFNPNKAYEGAEAEIASFLKIDKEKVAETTGDFSFEIKEITRHKDAEMNQELFRQGIWRERGLPARKNSRTRSRKLWQSNSLLRVTSSS